MDESDDTSVQKIDLTGLVRNHFTLILTLIPILLCAMRIFAVANGDRATLVTLLSTLDVKSVLLGTFAWLLPSAFGVVAAICWIRWIRLGSVTGPSSPSQRVTIFWLAIFTTVMTLILFLFAPVNDLFNLLVLIPAVYLFRKTERNRAGKAVIVVVAFVTIFLAPLVFRRQMWHPAERIAVKQGPAIVGYVLATDSRYATVLQTADSAVQIIPFDEVESRTICRLNPDLESASLVRHLFRSASERTPPC